MNFMFFSLSNYFGDFFNIIGKRFTQGLMDGAADSVGGLDGLSKNSEKIGEAFGQAFIGAGHAFSETFAETNQSMSFSILRSYTPTLIIFGLVSTALPLVYHYISARLVASIGKPPMAITQRRTTILTPLTNLFKKTSVSPTAYFNKEITDRIQQIAASIQNIKENKAYFQNVLLYGPPGVGKSMIAEQLARKSDMDFIMMSSGNLSQFIKRKEHVTELNHLLNQAERGRKPTLVFIDEAEGLARKREHLDQEHLELLNTFLARTGTPSKKIMIVLATNKYEDLDEAILSRMSHKIEISNPAYEQRIAIINQYAKELFANSPNYSKFFNPSAIRQMALKTENLSGRSLFYIINAIASKEGTIKNRALTQPMVDQIICDFVAQEKKGATPVKA